MRVYFSLLRFSLGGILCAGLDMSLFSFFYWSSHHLFGSTLAARAISMITNFLFVSRFAFRQHHYRALAFLKYLALGLVNIYVSYTATFHLMKSLGTPALPTKVSVELLLFVANYFVQRFFIFKKTSHSTTAEPVITSSVR